MSQPIMKRETLTVTVRIEGTDFTDRSQTSCDGFPPGFGIVLRGQQQSDAAQLTPSGDFVGLTIHRNGDCGSPMVTIASVNGGTSNGAETAVTSPFNPLDQREHTLVVGMHDNHIACYIDGSRVLTYDDPSFPRAGQVGVWADGVKAFVSYLSIEEQR